MITLGLLLALGGLGATAQPGSASAQSVPQPTPRPSLSSEGGSDGGVHSGGDMGHITGTVLDSATGAPVPYAKVSVGDQVVTADANGNYDLWLSPGTYVVTPVTSGAPAASERVKLPAGEIVVHHLSVATAPAAPNPAPTAVPTAAPAAKAAAPVHATAKSGPTTPARLPHTAGDPLVLFSAWFWVSLGVALLAGGLMIGLRADSLRAPAHALASYAVRRGSPAVAGDAAALLAALLTTEIRPTAGGGDDLLAALLAADTGRRRAAQELLADLLSRPVTA